MQPRIYLDHSATTPLHPCVADAMREALTLCGNPSSLHHEGRAAREAVESARRSVASLIGAQPAEVIFTSGGTESNNTALLSLAEVVRKLGQPLHAVTSPIEHPSVQKSMQRLADRGFRVTQLAVDSFGRIDVQSCARLCEVDPPSLVSLSMVNHELGNIFPVAELTQLAKQRGAWVHCDAVQGVSKLPISVRELGVDTLSVSAHKFYGPKGIGALFISGPQPGSCGTMPELPAFLVGGEQEKGRRAGTENVLAIVGFGRAAKLAQEELLLQVDKLRKRRERLENGLLRLPDVTVHGDPQLRSPTVCNARFAGVEGDMLLASLDLDGIAVSTGAACSSGSSEASKVLRGIGLPRDLARQAVRFSIGIGTTDDDIDRTLSCIAAAVGRIRALGPSPLLSVPPKNQQTVQIRFSRP
ncbi:MAG: cysteine desulfurase family protein [Polyangia bacterium]